MVQARTRSGLVEGTALGADDQGRRILAAADITPPAAGARFLGIPYAAAPVGPAAFEPPVREPAWEGVRDATQFGATIPQNGHPAFYRDIFDDELIDGDEQLNLNVWTPDLAGSAPVYVWIHGGAFVNGSGIVDTYDGTRYAADGIVAVTLNYRMSAPGFLDLGDGPANIGLRDQIAALEWVRECIADFGGDPNRVTIGGESAGAMSIGCLLASPAARGLFHGAILQSGAGHHAITPEAARAVGTALAEDLGIEPTREAFAGVDAATLLRVSGEFGVRFQSQPDYVRFRDAAANAMPFEPSIDGDVVPDLPVRSAAAGKSADVPILIGSTTHENRLFLVPPGRLPKVGEADNLALLERLGFDDPQAALAVFADPSDPSPGATMVNILSDWMFRIPAVRLAEARSASGASSPAYMYEFAWKSPAFDGELGAAHAVEIPFANATAVLSDEGGIVGANPPLELAEDMHAAWVRFITTGDAGWPAYTPESRTVEVFGAGPGSAVPDAPGGPDGEANDGPRRARVVDPYADRTAAWTGLR